MSRILLVRHGQTPWHAGSRYAGRTDIGLTAKGFAQAERLAAWTRTAGIVAVWSSPLSRARLTAEPAARAAGLPLRIDERLIELDFGRGEGLTAEEMEAAFPQERAAFELDPVRNFLPGAEDPEKAAERGVSALRAIAGEGRSLVVAHSTLLRLTMCALLGIPLARYRIAFPNFENCALTELDLGPKDASLRCFNVPLPEN